MGNENFIMYSLEYVVLSSLFYQNHLSTNMDYYFNKAVYEYLLRFKQENLHLVNHFAFSSSVFRPPSVVTYTIRKPSCKISRRPPVYYTLVFLSVFCTIQTLQWPVIKTSLFALSMEKMR